jgi:anti-sigma factor RsiW
MHKRWVATCEAVSDADLHSYLDAELSRDRSVAVAQYLLAHPDVARRVDAYAAQRDMLRAALAGPANETVPPELDLKRLLRERREQAELAPSTTANAAPRHCRASAPKNGTRRGVRIGPVTSQSRLTH